MMEEVRWNNGATESRINGVKKSGRNKNVIRIK